MYISDNFQSCLLTHLILARRPRSDLTGYIFEITTSVYHLISADYLALCTSLLLVLSNLSVFVQRTLDLGKCFGMPWPILEYISTNCIIIRTNNLHCADMFSMSFKLGYFVSTKMLNWVQTRMANAFYIFYFSKKLCRRKLNLFSTSIAQLCERVTWWGWSSIMFWRTPISLKIPHLDRSDKLPLLQSRS